MNPKNFDLFQQAMQWVVDYHRNPDEADGVKHDQGVWVGGPIDRSTVMVYNNEYYSPVCGTSCCLAGKAVLLNGDTVVGPTNVLMNVGGALCIDDQGEMHAVSARAADLFGISQVESAYLFSGSLMPEQLVARATEVAEAHGHDLVLI